MEAVPNDAEVLEGEQNAYYSHIDDLVTTLNRWRNARHLAKLDVLKIRIRKVSVLFWVLAVFGFAAFIIMLSQDYGFVSLWALLFAVGSALVAAAAGSLGWALQVHQDSSVSQADRFGGAILGLCEWTPDKLLPHPGYEWRWHSTSEMLAVIPDVEGYFIHFYVTGRYREYLLIRGSLNNEEGWQRVDGASGSNIEEIAEIARRMANLERADSVR